MAEPAGESGPAAAADKDHRIRGAGELIRVLIAGCGFVGTELGLQLGAAGHEVWGIRRDASRLPAPIHPISADLTALSSRPESRYRSESFFMSEWLPSVDRVVYAAAPDASTPDSYRAIYVEGLQNLLGLLGAAAAPIERLVLVSSTAVWGDADGAWVDETTRPRPEDLRGEILLEAESAARSGPFAAVVLRLGGIYGPGRTRLIDKVRSGEARCPEGESAWSNRIHRDDAAGMIAHLLTLTATRPIYVGVDDEPAQLCDVYRFVADRLGVPSPEVGPVATAAPSATTATRERSNKRCSNRRIRESGYRCRYPSYREGYRSMIQEGR